LGLEQNWRGADAGGCGGRATGYILFVVNIFSNSFLFFRTPLYSWRPYGQDQRLLMESKWAMGDLLGFGGQYHAGLTFYNLHCTIMVQTNCKQIPLLKFIILN
jgi:hypothetical protein